MSHFSLRYDNNKNTDKRTFAYGSWYGRKSRAESGGKGHESGINQTIKRDYGGRTGDTGGKRDR